MKAVLYVHGKGGCAAESARYRLLFPDDDVIGLEYRSAVPWEAGRKIAASLETLSHSHDGIILIANSVGAYYCMNARCDTLVQKAYFISPIVDMEALIGMLMRLADVSEEELRTRGLVPTAFGEDLSWEYLSYVRSHPPVWDAPTEILYGSRDELTSFETIRRFAQRHGAALTVMEGGEHWFHTQEQLCFLDAWIRASQALTGGKE